MSVDPTKVLKGPYLGIHMHVRTPINIYLIPSFSFRGSLVGSSAPVGTMPAGPLPHRRGGGAADVRLARSVGFIPGQRKWRRPLRWKQTRPARGLSIFGSLPL